MIVFWMTTLNTSGRSEYSCLVRNLRKDLIFRHLYTKYRISRNVFYQVEESTFTSNVGEFFFKWTLDFWLNAFSIYVEMIIQFFFFNLLRRYMRIFFNHRSDIIIFFERSFNISCKLFLINWLYLYSSLDCKFY